jgi:glutaredoxin 3
MIIQIVSLLGIAALIIIYTMMKMKSNTGGKEASPSNTRTTINGYLERAPVVIFSKSNCPFCTRAKSLFRKMGASFKTFELDKMKNGKDIQATLQHMTGQSTVPNIFVNGEHLGGNDVAQRKAVNGSLQRLLNL